MKFSGGESLPHQKMISETTQPCATNNGARVENGNDSNGEEDIGKIDELPEGKERVRKEMTMQDIYSKPDELDDDVDDTDWEPYQEQLRVKRWSCTNCTMLHFDGAIYCDICGEHKESGILKHGFLASPFSPGDNYAEGTEEAVPNKEKSVSQISASASRTAVGFDERMLLHCEVEVKPHPHPERPERLRAIVAGLTTAGIFPGKCQPIAAREITHGELLKVHSLAHVEAVELTDQAVSSYFTPDTYANQHSARAARLAAGLCADLASEIYCGHVSNGFALIRPPGHHAGVHQAMGFCLHNNAAIAALAAQAAGAKKVLILDWDVHHGNGTQEIFDGSTSVLYISLHRYDSGRFYPGTGASCEVGKNGAEGYCVNIPWSCGGVGDNDYIFAFQYVVLPIAVEFDPDFTIISAGFDAARGDPLGCCDVTPSGYARMAQMLSTLAGGKMLVILEGGYNLRSISSSAAAVIEVLLSESTESHDDNVGPSRAGMQTVLEVLKIQSNYWKSLAPNLTKLESCWEAYLLQHPKKEKKKKRRRMAVAWWMCSRKRLLYHVLFRRRLHPRPWGW